MMKKMLVVVAMLMLAAPFAGAQAFEALGVPIVVAGGTYQFEKPVSGNQAAVMVSANIAGIKVGAFPLYFGGVGVALPASVASLASQFGNFAMLTVPGVTWYPAGNKPGTLGRVCVQAGYSYVLNSDASRGRSGVYAGIGMGWDSPAFLQYKRDVKKYRTAKMLGKDAGPTPRNPYDVQ